MTIDCILPLTQNELFSCLAKFFKRQKNQKVFAVKKSYILVEGNAPIMLVAHLDTVHKTPVQTICRSEDGNILMSPEGIGGDDRCGVYALLEVYRKAETKPWLLFTCDEEIGGYGAEHFCKDFRDNQFPNELKTIKLIIEIDRKGSQDAVYYDCDCPELETYITTKGFQTDFGTFSDICLISPTMGIASVNLSSGYYNAHTLHEYIVMPEIENTITKVSEIVSESTADTFPVYKYKEHKRNKFYSFPNTTWNKWETNMFINPYGASYEVPYDLPIEQAQKYEMLLDIYMEKDLEYFRMTYGDEIIDQLYEEEFGDTGYDDDTNFNDITVLPAIKNV